MHYSLILTFIFNQWLEREMSPSKLNDRISAISYFIVLALEHGFCHINEQIGIIKFQLQQQHLMILLGL